MTGVTFNFIKEMVWGRLLPYLGFGIGYGNTDVDIQAPGIALDDGSSSFLWQVIAGLDFPYTERTSLFLEYRYMPISDFGLNVTGVASEWDVDDLTNHSAFAGIRYFF
ncbi:MAG: outer membrane beta-barrel protein [Verrucomicrobiota bacterium]